MIIEGNQNQSNEDQLLLQFRTNLLLSHELAHQWFGNLVTPRTWHDLWFSEGGATFFEHEMLQKMDQFCARAAKFRWYLRIE